ncbi:MAG: MAC/perforin domain-containing protein [Reichenbachiella sp.]|uniref:MAC/perforin domain-containing protein n=1 Tax=Reichenbachiella sp. TaxID=2184521 RepID=UPI00329A33EB
MKEKKTNKIQNLETYLTQSFNPVEGNFTSSPVFKLSYNGESIDWNGANKNIPDQISLLTGQGSSKVKSDSIMKTKSEFKSQFKNTLSASYSGFSYSALMKTSFFYSEDLFSDNQHYYSMNFIKDTKLKFERREEKIELEPEFITSLKSLPIDTDEQKNKDQYFNFFKKYGTHFLRQGALGGYFVHETIINKSLTKEKSEKEIKLAISMAYDGLISKGALDSDTAKKSSDFFETYKESVEVKCRTIGGDYSDERIKWEENNYDKPVLLVNLEESEGDLELVEISELLGLIEDIDGVSERRSSLREMIKAYMPKDSPDIFTNVFEDPVPVELNTQIEAKVDGFVMAEIQNRKNIASTGSLKAFIIESNKKKQIACCSQHIYTDNNKHISASSLMFPVAKGTTYYVDSKGFMAGDPSISAYFIGIGDGMENLLTFYSDLKIEDNQTAGSDGFVVGYVDAIETNESSSELLLVQNGEIVAGTSQHFRRGTGYDDLISNNSFCFPIRKGTKFSLKGIKASDYEANSEKDIKIRGRISVKAFFIGINAARYELAEEIEVGSKIVNIPTPFSDTFLTAFLSAGPQSKQNLGSAQICVKTMDNKNFELAKQVVHADGNYDSQVPYNTIMVPVSSKLEQISLNTDSLKNHAPSIVSKQFPLKIKQ